MQLHIAHRAKQLGSNPYCSWIHLYYVFLYVVFFTIQTILLASEFSALAMLEGKVGG
jgi:hypothetical protein